MNNGNQFDGKCVVVTGAAAGIGRATALHFARQGARVFAADIDTAGLESLASESAGIVPVQCDVCDAAQIKALMDQAGESCGGIDVLFNNAGAGGTKSRIDELEAEDWDRTMALLLRSVAMGIRHAVPHMKHREGSSIVNTSSSAATGPGDTPITYGVAKAGVVHITKCAAAELARYQIRVNAVLPGLINTNIYPTGLELTGAKLKAAQELIANAAHNAQPVARPGEPEDVAAAVAFLCSEGAGFINGVALLVDGGLTLGPRQAWDPDAPGLLSQLKAIAAAPEVESAV